LNLLIFKLSLFKYGSWQQARCIAMLGFIVLIIAFVPSMLKSNEIA